MVTMELDEEKGRFLVRTARETIEEFVTHRSVLSIPDETPEDLKEKAGVFVTIKTHPDEDLRGCIGHPYPDSPLVEALIDSGVSACTKDPRFRPVKKDELRKITVEITVLTPPEAIQVKKPVEYAQHIEVGRHGLIVRKGWFQGLLLPQVPVEYGWDAEEFLSQTCRKAGLPLSAWIDKDTQISRFEGWIFGEETPKGKISRKG
jgi:uncharacterized protein (TIGR00296 family)